MHYSWRYIIYPTPTLPIPSRTPYISKTLHLRLNPPTARIAQLLASDLRILMFHWKAETRMPDIQHQRSDGHRHAIEADEEVLFSQDRVVGPAWEDPLVIVASLESRFTGSSAYLLRAQRRGTNT